MPNIIVLKAFKFAHFGYQVEEFEPSNQPRETTQECLDEAVREGWALDADAAAREEAGRAAAEQAAREAGERGAAEEKVHSTPRKTEAHMAAPESKGE